jgi:hypothetical protein
MAYARTQKPAARTLGGGNVQYHEPLALPFYFSPLQARIAVK